ncbi:MAG TPA: acyltransferase family protein [Aeromicrobium sp.]|nr:acyltransferase family protein [Aeromicrobium sp.]
MIALLVGLRGLSVVLVVCAELARGGILPAEFGSGLNEIGLMIFVVTSGFVLALGHIPDPLDRHALAGFLRARALRLLPPYLIALAVSVAVQGWWAEWPYRFDSVPSFLRALFLVQAPGALWIVPVLAQCYLLFVVAWLLWSHGWSAWTMLVLALASLIPAVMGWYPHSGHGLAVVAPYFIVGIGVGLAWTSAVEPFAVRHLGAVSFLGGLSFVLVCVNVPAVRITHGLTLGDSILAATWFDPLNAIVVVALVVATATRPIALAVLGVVPLLLLGQYWYTVYLVAPVLVAALPG